MVKNLLGRDMSNFSISYELCGEHNIGLANSHPDNNLFSTIKFSLIMENGESVDDQLYIAQAIVTKIPSSFWSANKRPMPNGYDMVSIVDNLTDAKLLEVFSTLELLSSNELTIVTAALEENNFYFVEKIKVAQAFRGQGVGTFFAKMLPQWIQMITSEKEPLVTIYLFLLAISKKILSYLMKKQKILFVSLKKRGMNSWLTIAERCIIHILVKRFY